MRISLLLALPVALAAAAGCEPADAPTAQVTVTETAPAPLAGSSSSTPKAAPSTVKPSVKPKPKRVKVPSVVGMNHQAAQNKLQAAGLFMLREEDATGQGRMLLWDRNWVVVRQSPRAGAVVSTEKTVTLYSKKIGE